MNEAKKPRGFSTMPRERVREIAALGGKAAQATGTAHRWNAETARIAGRKGGRASHAKKDVFPSMNERPTLPDVNAALSGDEAS